MAAKVKPDKPDVDGPRGRPGGSSFGPTAATMNNPYWTASTANFKKNWKNDPAEQYFAANYKAPFPNAPHDGGTQDLANTAALTKALEKANNYKYAIENKPTWVDSLGMMVGLAPLAAVGGAFIAPLAESAAVGAGAASGGLVAGAAGGAAAGAFTGAGGALLTGQDVGKGLWQGGLMGGVGGAIGSSGFGKGAVSGLTNAGVNPSLATGIVKGGIGAGTGALKSAIGGGNIGSGAASGGVNGFISGAVGNATGNSMLGNIGGKVATGLVGNALGGSHPTNGGTHSGGGGANYIGAGALGAGAALLGSGGNGQGNIGNMAGKSTDSTLAGTIAGALPGVLQGAAGIYGSQNAAEKQTQADQHAIDTQTSTLGNINNIWSKQQSLGQGADTALGTALGTNGKAADYSGFENMPGYKFAISQGTQAIQRQAASMGNAYTPNTSEAVGQYVTGTAMQDYNTYINQLMGAAGLGNSANTGIANPTMQTGENISQLQQNQGQAQASGVSGAANAVGGMFGQNGVGTSLIGAAGRYLNGGAGGGGGGGGGRSSGGGGNLFNGPLSNWNNTGAGNGTWGSGYDPNTGSSWTDGGSVPSFDSGSWNDMPTMPGIEGGSTDFGGGLDYGSSSSDLNFLGGGWG